MTVQEYIDSSDIIQQAKAAYVAAEKIGDTAGMAAAHATAEAYRNTVGGYSTDQYGNKVTGITNESTYNSVYNTINGISSSASLTVDKVQTMINNAVNSVKNTVTDTTETTETTVIDSAADTSVTGYDPADYAVSYTSSSSESSNIGTYIGYALLGLVGIAVLSRFVDR